MTRATDALEDGRFDVAVVGGGATGAAVAFRSARLGWRTALVEAGDFGHATSANSLRVLHGGLRYLQQLDLRRMRDSIAARRFYFRAVPHLVRPQAFVIPTRGLGLQGRPVLSVALLLNDLISHDRNRGVSAAGRLPAGRVLGRGAAERWFEPAGLRDYDGVARWYDGVSDRIERVTLAFCLGAAEHGAVMANHVRAVGLEGSGPGPMTVHAEDRVDGASRRIEARVVVDATGPWHGGWRGDAPAAGGVTWARGMNVFVGRPLLPGPEAVGLPGPALRDADDVVSKGTRFYFFLPWHGGTLIGTHYLECASSPDDAPDAEEQLGAALEEINAACPRAGLGRGDVGYVHAGRVPARAPSGGEPIDGRLLKHSSVAWVRPGLLEVLAVKYTTAPSLARRVCDLIAGALGSAPERDPGAEILPGGEREPTESVPGGDAVGPPGVLDALRGRFGARASRVLGLAAAEPDHGVPLSGTTPCLGAEVVYAVREEMACTLGDVVFRRVGLAEAGHPGAAALDRCARIVGRELSWSPATMANERGAVDAELDRRLAAPLVELPTS